MSETKRVALVTGSAQGLGRAIAERLGQDGVSLIIGDLHSTAAHETAAEISASGGEAIGLPLDVSDEQSAAATCAAIHERFGRLDILVNNAGIAGDRAPVEEMSLAGWEKTLRVNLTGTFLMCRSVIPLMKRHKWGRIVNVSSMAGRTPTGPFKSNYAASKAGVIGFSRILAGEVGGDGITVNCVAPSRTLTELTRSTAAGNEEYFAEGIALTALGRLAEPVDTANAVAFLCSDQASFITGSIIDVNGGSFMA